MKTDEAIVREGLQNSYVKIRAVKGISMQVSRC